MPMLKNCSVE